ncbi:nuclear pore complex assembly-domain-containing protein [Naematelia encephala]|uniref:Nuclear pore complex assembly-domain-containing protein n=1 Tax=Naematelia encephala TaxID=71784 RepID=A0A1Y2AR21_9TREE|nr:nuclear pore complex assembly-domain-containing protein [Naematelia encephala]
MDEYIIPENILRWYNLASPPYTESSIERTTKQRNACPLQKLFFDQLLELAGLDGLSLYPASTPAGYRRLLHAVYSSDLDRIKRDCFFYYLLKDQDQYAADEDQGTSSQAEEFARKRCLPRMWRVFMTGYWSLDHSQWDDAVDALSDPAIRDINFLPSILHVLSTQVSPPSHAFSLLYTLLSGPHEPLVEEADRDIQLLATCSAGSIPEAFAWIRTHESPEVRVYLRESAWSWMLGVSRIGPSAVQAKALKELVHIPLLPEENAHLAHFLAHPPRTIAPPALSLLHDLVTLRFIHQGQYAEALQLDRDLAGSGGKEEDRQRRREMVREFIGVLPEAQRRVLSLQSDELAREKEKDVGAMMNGFVEREDDVDMTAVPIAEKGTPAPVDIPSTRRDAPASPAPQPLPRAHQSPFGGPPRFPSIARTASQVVGSPLRNISASPFRKPSTVFPSPSIPKPPRQIIDDDGDNDDQDSTPLPSRSRRSVMKPKSKSKPKSGTSAGAPSDAGTELTETEEPIEDTFAPPIPPRRSERIVSNTSQATSRHLSPPPPPPASPPSKRTSNRKGVTALGNTSGVPGAFPTSESAPAPAKPPVTPGRNTRSASRAILDDQAPPPKRSKAKSTSRAASEAPSEVSTSMSMTPGRATRRSTRRATTAQPSERGSPTPSVAASAGGRSTRGVRSGAREASATPRAKRTRK